MNECQLDIRHGAAEVLHRYICYHDYNKIETYSISLRSALKALSSADIDGR